MNLAHALNPTVSVSSLRSLRSYPCAVGLIIAITGVCAFAGLNRAPLEAHEAYVVQTAREMHDRGDLVVPWFHGEPRLNKPPLNYWLTIQAAALSVYRFEPWHGRAISASSWVLITALTIWIARMLFTRSVSLLSGAFVATSSGLAGFSHNARPDMLYAMWCTLILACFVFAWRADGRGWRSAAASYGMWIAAGLAALTKGPHQPLIFIACFAIIVLSDPKRRTQFWRILRPVSGLALCTAIALPWWLMLKDRVGGETLAGSQLGGTRYGLRISNIIEPLYLWQGWKMLLPWAVAFPALLIALLGRAGGGRAARLLTLLIGVTLAVLAFGGGKRWHYVLPLAAPATILMALGVRRFAQAFAVRPALWSMLVLPGHCVALIGIVIVASVLPNRYPLAPSHHAALIAGMLTMFLLTGALLAQASRGPGWTASQWRSAIAISAGVAAAFVVVVEVTGILDGDRDWNRVRFWRVVKDRVDEGTPLFALEVGTSLAGFYGDRFPQEVATMDDLVARLASARESAGVVLPQSLMKKLETRIPMKAIASVNRCEDDGDTWVLATHRAPERGAP